MKTSFVLSLLLVALASDYNTANAINLEFAMLDKPKAGAS